MAHRMGQAGANALSVTDNRRGPGGDGPSIADMSDSRQLKLLVLSSLLVVIGIGRCVTVISSMADDRSTTSKSRTKQWLVRCNARKVPSMTMRTRRERLFSIPSDIQGIDRRLPAGSYDVIIDDEMIEGLSFPSFRRVPPS